MSTTEALRLQLDALQHDFYALQVENRKLRERGPLEELQDVEQELAQTREENVRLVQQLSGLSENEEVQAEINSLKTDNERLRNQARATRDT